MTDSVKTLVAYFSASGQTARLARTVADATGGHLHEIIPTEHYTAADLDWNNPKSRSSVEMNDHASRPAVENRVEGMDGYDTVFVGFPIWWYVAPTIVSTFLEGYDLSGKTIIPFATSGGSGMGRTVDALRPSAPNARWLSGTVLSPAAREAGVRRWIEGLGL